jgi:hypothetical protein
MDPNDAVVHALVNIHGDLMRIAHAVDAMAEKADRLFEPLGKQQEEARSREAKTPPQE